MGYESKIYVVRKTDLSWNNEDTMKYAQEIAKFDMGKCYSLSDILREQPKTDCYIYADDGNTRILEDCYGNALTETSLAEAIEILKQVIAKADYPYWRYDVLLKSLEAINEWDNNFHILHYGY